MTYINDKIKPVLFSCTILLTFMFLTACIETYNPNLDEYNNLLVINGSIIKENSVQTIEISRTAPIDQPEVIPVANCQVNVVNGSGQVFSFHQTDPGIYKAKIPPEYLQFNERFKLQVTTPEGMEYESQYESILENSPIDSVYHITESKYSSGIESNQGLQFYLDLKSPEGFTKNYRWIVEETWEFHLPFILEAYFIVTGENDDGNPTGYYERLPEPIGNPFCWRTKTAKNLYSSSTQNLTLNEKKKIPLNYVIGESVKLSVKYSILVKQYSLSDSAYLYWNQNKVETQESGGLYQSQPSQSISNIRNINNEEELVLGFFWVSSYTEKRVFYKGPFGGYGGICQPVKFQLGEYYNGNGVKDLLMDLSPPSDSDSPSEEPEWILLEGPYCFDCNASQGDSKKPDFWDE